MNASFSDDDDLLKWAESLTSQTAKAPANRRAEALRKAADTLGVDAGDLGSIISFETGGTFDPHKVGGEGNKYKGLIQFGPDEQKSYYKPNDTFESQVENGVVRYFQDRFKKVGKDTRGASLEDLYTTVIAGNPNANRNAKDSFGTSARSGTQRILNEHRPQVLKNFFGGSETRINPDDVFSEVDGILASQPDSPSVWNEVDGALGSPQPTTQPRRFLSPADIDKRPVTNPTPTIATQMPSQLGGSTAQATPPMPEKPDTLEMQRQAANDPVSTRAAVLYTPGAPIPPVAKGETDVRLRDGSVLRANINKFNQFLQANGPTAYKALQDGDLDFTPLIGGKAQPTNDTGGKPAVVTRDQSGRELVASSVESVNDDIVATEAAMQKAQFPNVPTQTGMETAEEVVAGRMGDPVVDQGRPMQGMPLNDPTQLIGGKQASTRPETPQIAELRNNSSQIPKRYATDSRILDDEEPQPQGRQMGEVESDDNAVAETITVAKGTPQQQAREALKQLAPKYGFDAERVLKENPDLQITNDGEGGAVDVTFGDIRRFTGNTEAFDRAVVEQRTEQPSVNLSLKMPERIPNEQEAERAIEERIKEGDYSIQQRAAEFLGDPTNLSPWVGPMKLGNIFSDISEQWVTEEKDRLKKQHGSYSKAWDAEKYYQEASPVEKGVRMAAQTARSFTKNLFGGTAKSALFISDLVEGVDPVNQLLPDGAKVGLRNAGNYADFLVRLVSSRDAQTALKETKWVKGTDDLDKQQLFEAVKEFDKALGDDPVLKGRFLGSLSDAGGSALSFVALGAAMPSIPARILGKTRDISIALSGAAQTMGAGYEEGKGQGLSEKDAKAYGVIQGLLGTTEMLGAGAEAFSFLKNPALRGRVANALLEVPKAGWREAKQEFPQEVFQTSSGNAVMEYLKDNDPDTLTKLTKALQRLPQQIAKAAANEGVIGFLTGGVMGGAGKAAQLASPTGVESETQPDLSLAGEMQTGSVNEAAATAIKAPSSVPSDHGGTSKEADSAGVASKNRLNRSVPVGTSANSPSAEGDPNAPLSDAENLSSLLDTLPRGNKGLRSLDIPSQGVVMGRVLRMLENHEIRDIVVQSVPVNVVDSFLRSQRSAQMQLHDVPMLKDEPSVNADLPVSPLIDAADAIIRVLTSGRTKDALTRSLDTRRAGGNTDTAVETGSGRGSSAALPRTGVGAKKSSGLIDPNGPVLSLESKSADATGEGNHNTNVSQNTKNQQRVAEKPLVQDQSVEVPDAVPVEQSSAQATKPAETSDSPTAIAAEEPQVTATESGRKTASQTTNEVAPKELSPQRLKAKEQMAGLLKKREKVEAVVKPEAKKPLSNTQVEFSKEQSKPFNEFRRSVIAAEDVADRSVLPEYAKDGIHEIEPHITLKYGIHSSSADDVAPLLQGERPIELELGKTSVFKGSEKKIPGTDKPVPYDVVIVEAKSDDLARLNKKLTEGSENTTTFEYTPHVTLAYVKAGEGEKYAGKTDFEGQKYTFDGVTFSPADKSGKKVIPLGGNVSGDVADVAGLAEGLADGSIEDVTGKSEPVSRPTSEMTVAEVDAWAKANKVKPGEARKQWRAAKRELSTAKSARPTPAEQKAPVAELPARAKKYAAQGLSETEVAAQVNDPEFKAAEEASKKQKPSAATGFTKAQQGYLIKELEDYAKAYPEGAAYGAESVALYRNKETGEVVEKPLDTRSVSGHLKVGERRKEEVSRDTIIVPDDGTITVTDLKQANRLYQRLAGKPIKGQEKEKLKNVSIPAPPKDRPTGLSAKRSLSDLGATANDDWQRNEAYPFTMDVPIDEVDTKYLSGNKKLEIPLSKLQSKLGSGWMRTAVKGKRAWTDGKMLLVADEAPGAGTTKQEPDGESVLKHALGALNIKPVRPMRAVEGKDDALIEFDDGWQMPFEQYQLIKAHYPTAIFEHGEAAEKGDARPFIVYDGKDVVGLVMPLSDRIEQVEKRAARYQESPKEAEPKATKPEPASKAEAEKVEAPAVESKVADADKFQDFGEKIGGAKKDIVRDLAGIQETDLTTQPLSKVFPRPNFARLIADKAISLDAAKILSFLYDQIPAKPRKAWKVPGWVKKVNDAITIFKDVFGPHPDAAQLFLNMARKSKMTGLADAFDVYSTWLDVTGFPEKAASMQGYEIKLIRDGHSGNRTGKDEYLILQGVRIKGRYETAEAAAKALLDKLKTPTKTVFNVYQDTKTKDHFIGKKGAGGVVRLITGLDSVKAAREYIEANQTQLEQMWEARKYHQGVERKDTDEEVRIAKDWREGKDIESTEEFAETFGFRGVEFGNWVKQGASKNERQKAINDSYDALRDLAELVGVEPKALSLNGSLSLALGARGSGNASAHYEPTKVVINLTKTRGKGSLGHEWWHALDNYFSKMRGQKAGYVTDNPQVLRVKDSGMYVDDPRVRAELLKGYKGVVDAIRASDLPKRSRNMDATRSTPYWGTMVEMTARAFENYIVSRLAEKGQRSDFLANFKDMADWGRTGFDADAFPYPLAAEQDALNKAFDELFAVMEQEQTDDGNVILRSVPEKTDDILAKIVDDRGKIDYGQVKDVAGRIERGELEIVRLDRQAERGRIAGGRRNVEASLILAGSEGSIQTASAAGRTRLDSHSDTVKRQERVLEDYAKRNDIWFKPGHFPERLYLGKGGEARVYQKDATRVAKIIDYRHIDKSMTPQKFLDNRISLFNHLFPESHYELMGFMRDADGKFRVVVTQPLIQGVKIRTQADVDEAMREAGLERTERESYANSLYQVHDMHVGNVLKDSNGNVFVIDAVPKPNQVEDFAVVATEKPDDSSILRSVPGYENVEFEQRPVLIEELLKRDADLREFVQKANPVPNSRRKIEPIVLAMTPRGGVVADGYKRIAQAISNGKYWIDAFVQAGEPYLRSIPGLNKVRTPDAVRELEDLAKVDDFTDLIPKVETSVDGNILHLDSPEAVEWMRTVMAFSEEADRGKSPIIQGTFLNPDNASKMVDAAYGALDAVTEAEIDAGPIEQLIKNLETAMSATPAGTVILDYFDDALPHEQVHEGSYLGADGKPYESRYANAAEIKADPVFKRFHKALNKLQQGKSSHGVAMEEALAYLGTGDYARFGLSKDEAVELLAKLVEGYAAANGVESLSNFKEGTELYERIEAFRKSQSESRSDGDRSGVSGERETGRETAESEPAEDAGREGRGKSSKREKGQRVAAFSRILGEDHYYDPQGHEETEAKAQQLLSDKGTEQATWEALNGKPSAETMRVVYWELERLNGLADHYLNTNETEAFNAVAEEIADLSAKIVARQVKAGQEIEIAKTLAPLSPEVAILTATKMKKFGEGDPDAELTPVQAKQIIEIAKELKESNRQLAEATQELRKAERKIKRLESDKEPTRRSPQARMLKEYQKRKPDLLRRLQEAFPDSPMFNGEKAALKSIPATTKQTETEQFKNWFKDSKVVDENGEPLVVYHGTAGDISEFKMGALFRHGHGKQMRGIYFSELPSTASAYARSAANAKDASTDILGSNVIPAFVSLQNPAFFTEVNDFANASADELQQSGYDGAIRKNQDNEMVEIVAFHSTQIKSAIGNNGNFDENESSILRAVAKSDIEPEKAALLTEYAAGMILEGRSFDDVIQTLTDIAGTAEVRGIHADAVAMIRTSREMSDETKEKLKTRNEHYAKAKEFAKKEVPTLSGIAQDAEAMGKSKELVWAVDRLTGDKPKSINDVVRDIEKEFGLSVHAATDLAREADALVREIRKTRRTEADALREITPELREEMNRAKIAKARATYRLNRFLNQLANKPWLMERFNNDFRAKLVSNWGTQLFNAVQGVISTGTESVLDLMEATIKTVANPNADTTLDINAKDVWLPMAYVFSNNKQIGEQALAEFPEEYYKVHSGLLGDIELDTPKLAPDAHTLTKPFHAWFDKMDVLNKHLSKISGAKMQEMHFRNAIVASSFDQVIRKKSNGAETLKSAIANGTVTDYVTEQDAKLAADKALRVTFAALIDDPIGRQLKRGYDQLDKILPVMLNPVTFARFTYTTTKVMVANPLLMGALDTKGLGGEGYNARSIAKGVLGWSGVAMAYGLLSAFGDDDDRWETLTIDGKTYDIRRFFPMSSYFYVAHLIKNQVEGRPPPDLEELAGGFASLETDYFQRGAGMALLGTAYEATQGRKSRDEVGSASSRMLGSYFAGMLRFLKPAKDVLAQFDKEEATFRDYNDTAKEQFIKEISKTLPVVGRQAGTVKKDAVTGEDVVAKAPLARMVGINIVHPTFINAKQTPATEWAEKLFVYTPAGEWPEEQRQAFNIRKHLRQAVYRRLLKPKDLDGRIDEFVKQGKLTKRAANILRKDLTLSELQYKLKYGYKPGTGNAVMDRKLDRVMKAATDEEKADIEEIVGKRMKKAKAQ